MEPLFHSIRNGTLGGTLLVILLQVNAGELAKSAVLGGVGAIVSFCVTLLLRHLVQRKKQPTKH